MIAKLLLAGRTKKKRFLAAFAYAFLQMLRLKVMWLEAQLVSPLRKTGRARVHLGKAKDHVQLQYLCKVVIYYDKLVLHFKDNCLDKRHWICEAQEKVLGSTFEVRKAAFFHRSGKLKRSESERKFSARGYTLPSALPPPPLPVLKFRWRSPGKTDTLSGCHGKIS